MALERIGPFLGMNNLLPRDSLAVKDTGAYLADAVNVDIRMGGKIVTRKSYRKVLSATRAHSLWQQYFVDDTQMYYISGDPADPTKTVVLTGLTPGLHMSFTEHAGYICCSDGRSLWKIIGTTAEEFGVASPAHAPVVVAGGNGALSEGYYSVAVTHRAGSGERSGSSPPVSVYVQANGRMTVSSIPQRAGYTTELFVTSPNGTDFYYYGDVGSTADVALVAATGALLDTLLMERLPAGHIARSFGGRLVTAVGSLLYYTDPWSTLHDPMKGFIPFTEPITMIEPCGAGMFVSADATYWLSGDLVGDSTAVKRVLPYKAVACSSGKVPNKDAVYWMSERGFCLGAPDGSVANIQESTVAVKPALYGASLFREEDGSKQLITSTFSPKASVMAASTYADAEVIHQTPT